MTAKVLRDNNQTYYRCAVCYLHFVHPDQRPGPVEEKEEYDLHQNDPNDPHYRTFLSQLFEPVKKHLPPGSSGLDYGSGPGPALHLMFEEAGFEMKHFDPIYHNKLSLLNMKYDFITVSETAEHFYHPGKEFQNLWKMLNPGGLLGIMTLLLTDPDRFKNWFYRRERTHVSFYQKETFNWLAKKLNAKPMFFGDRVILFQKLNMK